MHEKPFRFDPTFGGLENACKPVAYSETTTSKERVNLVGVASIESPPKPGLLSRLARDFDDEERSCPANAVSRRPPLVDPDEL